MKQIHNNVIYKVISEDAMFNILEHWLLSDVFMKLDFLKYRPLCLILNFWEVKLSVTQNTSLD